MKLKLLLLPLFTAILTLGVNNYHSYRVIEQPKKESLKLSSSIDDYYASIDDSLEGTELLNALKKLNDSKRKRTVGYNGMRSFAKYSDADPKGSGKIVSFYDNALIGPDWDSGNTWNREHVWPNSKGGDLVEDDAFMPRPCSTKTNGDRGNDFFAATGAYDPGQFVPEYRGISARIIFYCCIVNTSLTLVDKNYDSSANKTMGKLSDLLKWNLEYDPSSLVSTSTAIKVEVNRNDVVQNHSSGQGNRNPFVDHPEYACKIWGDTNSTTREICAAAKHGRLESITKTGTPNKTSYGEGENFDPTGLTIMATFEDGTTSNVTKQMKWSPSPLTKGTTKVIGTYTAEEVSKTIEVTGITVGDSLPVSLASSGMPKKTEYHEGENFDPTGLKIYATYTNGSSKEVTSSVVWEKLVEGKQNVKGKYNEQGVTLEITISGIIVRQKIKSKGCGGSILATSSLLTVLSFSGLMLLKKRRK